MRRILFFVFLLVSIVGFSQNPSNYQYRTVRERLIAFMVDSSFHLPRYNGVPSGLRVGMSPNDGALAADTLNGHFYGYWNTTWKRLAYYTDIAAGQVNIYNSNGTLTDADRYVRGLNDTKGIVFDSMNYFLVTRTNVNRLYINNLVSRINSPDESQWFGTENDVSYVIADNNFMRWETDSTISRRKIVYPGNLHGLFNAYTLVDKSYVDSVAAASGGGTPGGSDKQVQYNNAGSFGGSAGFETALTNLRTKITAQATTEVPLEIKLASSQTANALNISSSSGTGDLANIDANGRLTVEAGTNADGGITFGSGAAFYKTGAGAVGWSTSGGGGYGALGNGSFELYPVASGNTMSRGGGNVGAAVTAEFTMSPGNVSWLYQLGTSATTAVDQTFRAQNTTGSDKVGSNLIIQSGNGTGNTTTGSALQFQTPDATGSGSSAQAYTTKFQVNKLGQLKANLYGSGTFTGTATKFLAVDASGNLIEEDPPSGGVPTLQQVLDRDLPGTPATISSNSIIRLDQATLTFEYDASASSYVGMSPIETGTSPSFIAQLGSALADTVSIIDVKKGSIALSHNTSGGGSSSIDINRFNIDMKCGADDEIYISDGEVGIIASALYLEPPGGTGVGYALVDLLGDGYATWQPIFKQGTDVASAAGAISVGSGTSFELTGTAAVTLISNVGRVNGAEITLWFTSTASLTDGTANSGTDIGIELNANTNFTGSAGSSITLQLIEIGGTQRWREKCRSVN